MLTGQLGDYLLVKPLGQGSMGRAYLAEHRLMKRTCVVKVLPPELSEDPGFIQRFETEVHSLSSLEHPHIIKIHNVSFAEGKYFLVTDFVGDGEEETCNLAQYIRKRKFKLSEEEVLRIARQVAFALDYAHQRKMGADPFAHGSLKLNNIIVRSVKEGIQVFISDFGLSRIIGPGAVLGRTYKAVIDQLSANVGFTWDRKGEEKYIPGDLDQAETAALHGSFLQNFAFLSPEQKISRQQRPNPIKADIYAFGVMLYYLILGEFPDGFYDLPSNEEGYKWNWDLLIARCMHKDPERRPDLLAPVLEELLSSTSAHVAKALLLKLQKVGEEKATREQGSLESSSDQHTSVATPYTNDSSVATLLQLRPVIKPQEIARPSFEPDPGAIFQTETVVARYQPQPQEERLIEPLLTEMAVIPSGSYLRGSNSGGRDELPRHQINISAFAIDVHPVTNEQFVRFLEAMGGEKDVNNNDIIRLRDSRIKRSAGKLNIESGYAKHPIVGVTWYGAVAYAKWVGKRLPTEAEWEIASYGGQEESIYPTGSNIDRSHANFFSADTTPVMSYPPNDYGLYDMAGNVYEWCQDWYDYHYYDNSVQEPDNPKGPLQGVYRVLRGGCWKSLKEDLRCAHRHRNNPGIMNGTYGFRCAADVADE